MARTRRRQEEIVFRTHGGKRRGAGRRAARGEACVSHRARADVCPRAPVLVTLKLKERVWNLRTKRAVARLLPAFLAARERFGMRLVMYSVQGESSARPLRALPRTRARRALPCGPSASEHSCRVQGDHIHLIVEVDDRRALARGMQGLSVRIARTIHRMMGTRGGVFADRYHHRVLATPRQVRHAIRYVFLNARKHGHAPRERGWLDPFSSALAFDGWLGGLTPAQVVLARERPPPVVSPRTWLLAVGWKRAGGAIDPDERPGPMLA